MELCQILVVDDDKEDQEIIHAYFKEAGVTQGVCYVENGQEAIDFLNNIVSLDAHLPKLVILDLNMPILNGTETLFQLKNDPRYKNVPVVIFSTSENGTEKQKCLSYGAENYLIKPVTDIEGESIMKLFCSFLDKKKIEL